MKVSFGLARYYDTVWAASSEKLGKSLVLIVHKLCKSRNKLHFRQTPQIQKPSGVCTPTAFDGSIGYLSRFAVNRDRDVYNYIRVQGDADSAVANHLDGAIGHANLCLDHLVAGLVQFFGDVGVGYRAKQASVHTSFLGQLDRRAGELLTHRL